MALVSILKDYIVNVGVQLEKQNSENGSLKNNYAAIVQSNIPPSFKINLPIFKGMPKEELEVEFYVSVDGREVRLQLVSAGAEEIIEEIRDKVIDEQIALIREVYPEIVIIEQ
jgi:hypothetical protein